MNEKNAAPIKYVLHIIGQDLLKSRLKLPSQKLYQVSKNSLFLEKIRPSNIFYLLEFEDQKNTFRIN